MIRSILLTFGALIFTLLFFVVYEFLKAGRRRYATGLAVIAVWTEPRVILTVVVVCATVFYLSYR